MAKKRIFLTGASGSMGHASFLELMRRSDRYDTVLLLRPSRKNRRLFKPFAGRDGLRVVWGDLTNPSDVLDAVTGVDHVLHPAAMIAPAADHNPPMAKRCNHDGTVNIIEAIKKQPNGGDQVRLVNVCTVAAYGDRLAPVHMAKVGDPLKPSVGDYYATTKIAAERAVIESGLRWWASMRQTYIAIPKAWTLMDPIMFHQPLDTHIELITDADAGYGLVQSIEAPDEFYGRVYNMGGGPSCQVVYQDYMERSFRIFGLGDFRKVMDRNWFALRNFHCCWYEDSHVLNGYLGHWRHSLEDHYRQVKQAIPWYLKLGTALAPGFVLRAFMKKMADPLKWIQKNETEKIKAFFGSREAWERIGDWSAIQDPKPGGSDQSPTGYLADLDTQKLAAARGGRLVRPASEGAAGKAVWRCAFGHEWEASETLVRAGHWCPSCGEPPWDRDRLAAKDPALWAIYHNNHEPDEHQKVDYLYCPNE